jgi:hypothetical protein
MHTDRWTIELERARRRRDSAAPSSPDWDAASEAVLELEALVQASRADHPRQALYLVEALAAG